MSALQPTDERPRIEDFKSDLSPDEITAAKVRNTRSIAMQAYLHAFPAFLNMRQLTEFIQGRRHFAPDEFPLGGWILMRDLATSKTNTVSPNVDTLYGASYLLLDQQGPVVLSVPPIPDRYYSVAILDAYFNNFAIISPRTFGNDGGNYLIAPSGWADRPPEGIKAIFIAPTPSVCLLQRIFTRNPGEYGVLHQLQDAIRMVPLDRWRRQDAMFPAVDLSPYEIQGMRMIRDPLQFFEHTNYYTGLNPPPMNDSGLMELFKTAGVGPGSRLPSDPMLRDAIVQGAADAQGIINARTSLGPFRNGWRIPDPNSGRSGPFLLDRAVVQMTQMGLFPLEEAIYFFGFKDSNGQALHGSHRYTLTFKKGELPPLREYGFWSLTMYNQVSLLVENPFKRYILRPDSPGLAYEQDGSLIMYIQADRPTGVPEGNWLPASAGEFNVALRTYLPQKQIIDGKWFPPGLERID